MHLHASNPLLNLKHTASVSRILFGIVVEPLLWSRKGTFSARELTTARSLHLKSLGSGHDASFGSHFFPIKKIQRTNIPLYIHHSSRPLHAAAAQSDATRDVAERRETANLSAGTTANPLGNTGERNVAPTTQRLKFLTALSQEQTRQITQYVDALLEWNQKFNLTAITERTAVLERHIEDSLVLLPHIDKSCLQTERLNGKFDLRIVDVGTGAGLPGVVFAIARPEWKVTLVESLRKRCDFLRHVIAVAGLTNVNVVWARAEDVGRDENLREVHDVAIARAVADMRILSELCLPLVAVGGLFVAPKGPTPEAEVAAAEAAVQMLGGRLLTIQSVESQGRSAVIYLKDKCTPSKYPRRAGLPAKRPL